MKSKSKISIAMFMMFLIVCIPIVIADSISGFVVADKITGMDVEINQAFGVMNIELPEPDDMCEEKVKVGQDFISFMDSGIIKTLTETVQVLYAITTTLKTIHGITSTLAGVFPGGNAEECKILPHGLPVCLAVGEAYKVTKKIDTIWKPITLVVMCQSEGALYPGHGWCTEKDMLFGLGGGREYKLDPFENIYTAVGCLCPTAILFNLRKLKLIYKTFNCCVESACEQGTSIEGCYKYLDESTCMYWEGSLLNMVWDIIVVLVAHYLGEKIINYATENLQAKMKISLIAILDMVEVGFAIAGLGNSLKWLVDNFGEPDCSGLLEQNLGISPEETTTAKAQREIKMNNQGVYDQIV